MLFMLLLEQDEVDGNMEIKDLKLEALGEVCTDSTVYANHSSSALFKRIVRECRNFLFR